MITREDIERTNMLMKDADFVKEGFRSVSEEGIIQLFTQKRCFTHQRRSSFS